MANLRYFADLNNGETLQLDRIRHDGGKKFSGWTGAEWVKVTRVIERKSMPSLHECDARCMFATGKTMRCECACGGKNHGKGSVISCEAA